MFDEVYEIRNIGISQRRELQEYLSSFLELGRFIQIKDKLKYWCKKVGAKPVRVSKQDCSRVNSWQALIATLLELAEKSN